VQISICLIILCVQLGPSALAGFSLFILAMPLQERLMAAQFKVRRSSTVWTDKRAKLLLETLSSMRVVKYFTYELSFIKRRPHYTCVTSTLIFLHRDIRHPPK
jgi:ATP-binding cassette, subfamily C (CFTR/MRP), member 1